MKESQEVTTESVDESEHREEWPNILITYSDGTAFLCIPIRKDDLVREKMEWERCIMTEDELYEKINRDPENANEHRKRRDVLRVRFVFEGDEPLEDRCEESFFTNHDPAELDRIRNLSILPLHQLLERFDENDIDYLIQDETNGAK